MPPESLEDLSGLGDERLPASCLTVLEQGDREPEIERALPEEGSGGPVAGLVPGQLGPQPVGVGLEEVRALSRPERLDPLELLLHPGLVAEREGGLERLAEALVHRHGAKLS